MRRVAVVGAECVGKTSLCEQLARALPALWIPEALREFCARRGRTPTAVEQALIVRRQVRREAACLARAAAVGVDWVLCDSAPLVTALYSVHYFGDRGLLESALAHHRQYSLSLLLQPDLPWQPEGIQRDGPRTRAQFHALLTAQLVAAGIAYRPIGGNGPARLAEARAALGAC